MQPFIDSLRQPDSSFTPTEFWTNLIAIGVRDPETLAELMPDVARICRAPNSPVMLFPDRFVDDGLRALWDASGSLPERRLRTLTLLFLCLWLPEAYADAIFQAFIKFTQDWFNAYGALPKQLSVIWSFPDDDARYLDDEQRIWNAVKPMLGNPAKGCGLFLVAVIWPLLREDSRAEGWISEIVLAVESCLQSDAKIDYSCACAVLCEFPADLANSELIGDACFDRLVALMADADSATVKTAGRALVVLVSQRMFRTEDHIFRFLKLHASLPPAAAPLFVAAVSEFILPGMDCEEEFEDEEDLGPFLELPVVQPIVNWLQAALGNSDEQIRAVAVSIIGDVLNDADADVRKLLADLIPTAFSVAEAIVHASHLEHYEAAAIFLAGHAAAETADRIAPLFQPLALALCADDWGTAKSHVLLCEWLARVVGRGVGQEHLSLLTDFLVAQVPSAKPSHLVRLASAALILKKLFEGDQASRVFAAVAARAALVQDRECFDALAGVLAALLKRHAIEDPVVRVFLDPFLAGELPVFLGRPPPRIALLGEPALKLINRYIQQRGAAALADCRVLCAWAEAAVPETLGLFLHPLETAVASDAVDDALMRALAVMARGILTTADSQFPGLGPLIAFLRAFHARHPEALDPVGAVLALLGRFIPEGAQESEEEDEEDEAMLGLTCFVFEVYAADAQAEVLPDLLLALVRNLPRDPGASPEEEQEFAALLTAMAGVLEDPERFECMVRPVVEYFVMLLMLPAAELEGYHISEGVIATIKATVKRFAKQDRELREILAAPYKGSRAKMKRFNLLLR
jgi:hypothetical protein